MELHQPSGNSVHLFYKLDEEASLLYTAEWGDQLANLGRGVSAGELSPNVVIRRRKLGLVPSPHTVNVSTRTGERPRHSPEPDVGKASSFLRVWDIGTLDVAKLMTAIHIHTECTPSPQTLIYKHGISLHSFRFSSQRCIIVFSVNVLQFIY